jgi:hypothetical protein
MGEKYWQQDRLREDLLLANKSSSRGTVGAGGHCPISYYGILLAKSFSQPKSSPSGVIDIDFVRQSQALRSDHSLRLNNHHLQKPADARTQRCAPPHSAHLAHDSQRRSSSKSFLRTELNEQCLGVLQVGGVEAFGEPVVDVGEHRTRVIAAPLLREQASEAHGRAKL